MADFHSLFCSYNASLVSSNLLYTVVVVVIIVICSTALGGPWPS
jgi:hypothetical protein